MVVVDSVKNLTSGTMLAARRTWSRPGCGRRSKWNAGVFFAYAFFLDLFLSVIAAGLYFAFSGGTGASFNS